MGSVGTDASRGFVIQSSPLVLALQTAAGVLSSVDSGSHWDFASGDCLWGFDGVPTPQKGGVRNFGTTSTTKNKMANYTSFGSVNATSFVASPQGVVCSIKVANISFAELPHPVSCGMPPGGAFGCPFRLEGGDTVVLADGSLLLSAIVYWGGSGVEATSVVAFGSTETGIWTYRGTIADASAYPLSQEGPNENALAALADGTTVVSVVRLDAGDGPSSHPYANYTLATSTDGGRTWSKGRELNAGCARPRLLHLGADGRGGISPAPLLLSGGRWRRGGYAGWDALMWIDSEGDATKDFSAPMSLSFWHNALAPNKSWHFTSGVNETTNSNRQTMAYTSILQLDGGPSPGRHSRRLGISYNRHLPPEPDVLFMMPFTVQW